MSTQTKQHDNVCSAPPLQSGDRLDRAEFERRYAAHPEIKKAELVEGVVYVPSPVQYRYHAKPHSAIVGWLIAYSAATPGVSVGDNATLRLDAQNEVQPDAVLLLEPALGGRSYESTDGYLEGVPELVVEVAASSASYDLHDKRHAYARNGVPEFLVIQTDEQRADWFTLRAGVYATLPSDEQGILRSEIFPGLWLQPAALWSGDLASLLKALHEGLNSPEHAAFVAQLQEKLR
jgi:Uma2 family endonuclease